MKIAERFVQPFTTSNWTYTQPTSFKISLKFLFCLKVADQIWICEKQTVTKWDGDISSYKDQLKAKVMKQNNKDAKSKFLNTEYLK